VETRAQAIVARASVYRAALIALMLVWAARSLARLGPLDDATPPESGSAPLTVLAVAGLALYGTAAYRLHDVLRRPRPARGQRDAQRVLRARDPGARVKALGAVALKGKREPVEAYVLERLDEG
jgi:hypothetical protein